MEISGLPLHVLALHGAVVFGPVSALIAIAYAALPSWRDRLRWVTLVVVLIGVASIWVAYLSGESFFESDRFANVRGEALEKIEAHEEYAEVLRLVASGFGIVTIAATWLHDRTGAVRHLLRALVVVGAVLTLVWTILTGDAGARAVWEV
jgi:multisubunit Na+/H+ antiporter MnhB subunit